MRFLRFGAPVVIGVLAVMLAYAVLVFQNPAGRIATNGGVDAILAPGARLEKVVGEFRFAESPLWRPDGSVLVSDVVGNTIWKVEPGAGLPTKYRSPSAWANGEAEYIDGTVLTAEHAGTISKTEADGTRVELLDSFEGKRLNSPDDLAVAPDGVVYFTDPPFGQRDGMGPTGRQPELGFSGVYRWDPRSGAIKLLSRDLSWPNGIALAPDAMTLYVGDSKTSCVHAFALDRNGNVTSRRVLADLSGVKGYGVIDGMKVDAEGRIFIAMPDGVGVIAAAGDFLMLIRAPEAVTNIAFGDADGKTLYISGRKALYKLRTKTSGIAFAGPR